MNLLQKFFFKWIKGKQNNPYYRGQVPYSPTDHTFVSQDYIYQNNFADSTDNTNATSSGESQEATNFGGGDFGGAGAGSSYDDTSSVSDGGYDSGGYDSGSSDSGSSDSGSSDSGGGDSGSSSSD